jgi:hypothetical protein
MRLTDHELLASSAGLREAWLGSQLRRWLGVDPPALEWASEAIGRGPVSSAATGSEINLAPKAASAGLADWTRGFLFHRLKTPDFTGPNPTQ